MGCGRESWENDHREAEAKRVREGFKAIASNDDEIRRFVDKLENVLRQLHEVKGQDLALRQIDHRRIDAAHEGARSLMEKIMTTVQLESPRIK